VRRQQRFLALVLLFMLASTLAQPQASSPATRTAEISIRGCVSGEKRYTFMQASTGAVFSLTGDSARFASLRGKFSEVRGTEYAPQQPNSSALPELRIKDIRVIADQCPIQPGAAPTRAAGPSSQGPRTSPSPATAPYADPGTATQNPPNVNNPNISGETGAPSPGTGNRPKPPQ
jgi:TolA-binding protein